MISNRLILLFARRMIDPRYSNDLQYREDSIDLLLQQNNGSSIEKSNDETGK